MKMISGRVPSDCIGCGDEDDSSHDSTLSRGVIKLCLCFFVCFKYVLSSGENLPARIHFSQLFTPILDIKKLLCKPCVSLTVFVRSDAKDNLVQ